MNTITKVVNQAKQTITFSFVDEKGKKRTITPSLRVADAIKSLYFSAEELSQIGDELISRWNAKQVPVVVPTPTPTPIPTPTPVPGAVSWSTVGWPNGTIGKGAWAGSQIVAADRFQMVAGAGKNGRTAAQVVVRPGDDPISDTGERSEVYAMMDASGNMILESESSGTQFYGFSIKLDEGLKGPDLKHSGGYWNIVAQLHGPNSLNTSPIFALNATDQYYGYLYAGDLDSDSKSVGKALMLSDSSLQPGKWVDWIVMLPFAKANGAAAIWRRNEGETAFRQVFSEERIPTLQYRSSVNGGAVDPASYWKHGLYRPKGLTHTNRLWLGGMARSTTFDAVAGVL